MSTTHPKDRSLRSKRDVFNDPSQFCDWEVRGVSRANGLLLVSVLVAACSAPPASTQATVAPNCEGPPTIIFGETGTPIPIVLQCDKAVAEAMRAVPAAMSGNSGSRITSIDFGYGRYCPPDSRCGPFAGQGELGFVLFGFSDGSSRLVSVMADPNGVVRVTNSDPIPTRSPSAGS